MRNAISLLCCLCSVLILPACGDEPDDSNDNAPAPRVEADAGPVVPETGVVVILVNPNRPYPECLYPPEVDAAYLFEAAETAIHAIAKDVDPGATVYCQRLGANDRLRFWVLDEEVFTEDGPAMLADTIAEQFMAKMDETFSEYWAIDMTGYEVQHAEADEAREAAQVAARQFREARRGLPDTPESRREWALLNHAVDARNDEVGELQKKMRAIEEERQRGQRVFRRLSR